MHSCLSLQVLENVHLGKINDDSLLPKRSLQPSQLAVWAIPSTGVMLIQPDHLPTPGILAVISALAEGSLKALLEPQLSVHRYHLAGGILHFPHPTPSAPSQIHLTLCQKSPHSSPTSLSSWAECSPYPKSAPARRDPLVSGDLSSIFMVGGFQ